METFEDGSNQWSRELQVRDGGVGAGDREEGGEKVDGHWQLLGGWFHIGGWL